MSTTDSISVLLIDSDADEAAELARALEPRGFAIDVRTCPAGAFRAARAAAYAVIVVDSHLPTSDGLSVIATLKPLCEDAAFVVMNRDPNLELRSDEALDGAIASVVSRPCSDDEFVCALGRAAELHRGRLEAASARGLDRHRSERVLLVDGHAAAAARTRTQLLAECEDRVIDVVSRLDDALVKLHAVTYDVAVTALSLPDARGLDAVAQIHRASPQTALIVLSHQRDPVLVSHALQLGAQDFLYKCEQESSALDRAVRYATERKQVERRLAHLAHFDQLTGLANRLTFRDRLSHALNLARRRPSPVALLYVDLNAFKAVNDTLGHQAGDAMLQAVGDRLSASVRECDTVARLGGDEFAIILEDVDGDDGARVVADRILAALRVPMLCDGHEVIASVSIGGALFAGAADPSACDRGADALIKAADVAMYRAKACSRGCYHAASAPQRCSVIDSRSKRFAGEARLPRSHSRPRLARAATELEWVPVRYRRLSTASERGGPPEPRIGRPP